MEIKFTPLDPLFFRNGRPFSAGEESWADSIFPPNPSVLYGALRTALATASGKAIPFSEVKTKLSEQVVRINRLYYLWENTPYYAMPLDYMGNGEKNSHNQYTLHLAQAVPLQSVIPPDKAEHLKYRLKPPFNRAGALDDAIVTESTLLDYLQNETPVITARRLKDLVLEEPKVGIGRSNQTRSVDEGLLYRVGMQRIQLHLGMTVSPVPGYNLGDIDNAQVRLGGEGKIALLNAVDNVDFHSNMQQIRLNTGWFKLYFATPALIDNNTFLHNLDINATLVGASIGKLQSIGGYDMAANTPKTMYKAIPAGSVLYYQTSETPDTIAALQGQSFGVRKEEGFGIAYFGNFTPFSPEK